MEPYKIQFSKEVSEDSLSLAGVSSQKKIFKNIQNIHRNLIKKFLFLICFEELQSGLSKCSRQKFKSFQNSEK
jgi:hypothetical protein